MIDPQPMFRAVVQPLPSGKAILQVRIGDLFQTAGFTPPMFLEGGDPATWEKGEPRKVLDALVVSMCKKIVANGSIFKHREGCTVNVAAMAPCPQCQGASPTEGT